MASTLRTARSVSRSKAEDVGVESTLVGEEDFDGDGAGDDVSVGDDVAVGVDNDAGAEALAAGEGGTGGAFVGPVGCDLDFDDGAGCAGGEGADIVTEGGEGGLGGGRLGDEEDGEEGEEDLAGYASTVLPNAGGRK